MKPGRGARPATPGERPAAPAGFESPYPTAISQISRTGWRLIDHIVWHGTTRCGQPITIEVEPGRETDFASTPPGLWSIFPPYGHYTAAAIVHDHLWRVLVPAGVTDYAEADRQLREMLRASGVSWLRRWTMWAAVRWGSLLTRGGGSAGWANDAPGVVAISIVTLPYVAAPFLVNVAFRGLFAATEGLISTLVPSSRGTRTPSPKEPAA